MGGVFLLRASGSVSPRGSYRECGFLSVDPKNGLDIWVHLKKRAQPFNSTVVRGNEK